MREFRAGSASGVCLVSALVAASSATAYVNADQFISFQGRVTDTSGTPIEDGTHLIDFFIYDVPTGGTPIGAVLNVSVVVEGGNGVVATPVGPVDAAWFNATPRYLGLTVDDNDDNPAGQEVGRVPFTAVPSALVAWNLAPGAVVSATSVALTNSLNIGGSSANGKLNVQGTGNGVPVASFSQPAGVNWIDFASNVAGGNWGTVLRFTNAGATSGSIASSGNGFMAFRTPSDSVAIAIAPDGDVGIGTSSPQFKLDVRGAEPDLRLQLLNESAGGRGWQLISTGEGSGVAPGSLRIRDTSAGDRLVISPTGNVGVGTSTPQSALHVNGTTTTGVLQITGGADVAEPFRVNGANHLESNLLPGMVVVIDPSAAGELRVSTDANDPKVAGVVSGANGVEPGLVLRSVGDDLADGPVPVALTGRVWCWCDASFGDIQPGDRLTTSPTAGHAMRVQIGANSDGAVLGKAMSELRQGRGLVLVLVNLQ